MTSDRLQCKPYISATSHPTAIYKPRVLRNQSSAFQSLQHRQRRGQSLEQPFSSPDHTPLSTTASDTCVAVWAYGTSLAVLRMRENQL